MNRTELIHKKLTEAFAPSTLEVVDEGHLHVGHPGTRDGRGHFAVSICAEAFAGKSKLQQHQMIYKALGEMMEQDIHALSIKVL